MATTNRSYVLDMTPGGSLIEFLVQHGYDVYVIDWEAPRPEEKSLRLEDYTQDFIPSCIRRIQDDTGEEDVSILGYCMGGVCYLGIAMEPDVKRSLMTLYAEEQDVSFAGAQAWMDAFSKDGRYVLDVWAGG